MKEQGNALQDEPSVCEKRPCGFCQKEFMQQRTWQKFCTVKCRNDAFWSTHKRKTVKIKC